MVSPLAEICRGAPGKSRYYRARFEGCTVGVSAFCDWLPSSEAVSLTSVSYWFKSIRRPTQKMAAVTSSSVIIPSSMQRKMAGNIRRFSSNRSTKITSQLKYPVRRRTTSEWSASLSV